MNVPIISTVILTFKFNSTMTSEKVFPIIKLDLMYNVSSFSRWDSVNSVKKSVRQSYYLGFLSISAPQNQTNRKFM